MLVAPLGRSWPCSPLGGHPGGMLRAIPVFLAGFGAGRCLFGHAWEMKGLLPFLILKLS